MSQHGESSSGQRPPPTVEVKVHPHQLLPSSSGGVVARPQQAPRTAQRPRGATLQRLAGCELNSCTHPPRMSNRMSCRRRPSATTRHRVKTSMRHAAIRERDAGAASQPMLSSCEGAAASNRGGRHGSGSKRSQKRQAGELSAILLMGKSEF